MFSFRDTRIVAIEIAQCGERPKAQEFADASRTGKISDGKCVSGSPNFSIKCDRRITSIYLGRRYPAALAEVLIRQDSGR